MAMAHLPVHTVTSHSQTRTAWTAQEDAILRARVAAIGAGAGLWPEVAKGLPGRTSKSCAERWQTHLNPAYVRSSEQEFSEWEIAVMILAYARHGSNWLKVSEYLPMRSPQNIKNQVNYFNSKPEHVRDNRFLAARVTLEELLAAEPEVVKQRRDTLRDVLIKGQSALPAGALQAAYAAAKLSPPVNGTHASNGRLHPYARPTTVQAYSHAQQASMGQIPAMPQPQAQPQVQPGPHDQSPSGQAAMNAMMLLAQAACGEDEQQDDSPTAASTEMEVEIKPQISHQHGLQLPLIQTRPQQHLQGSGGSSGSSKQNSSKAMAQLCYYPTTLPGSNMPVMVPGVMMLPPGMQGSPTLSGPDGRVLPANHPAAAAAAAMAAATKQSGNISNNNSPAATPLAAAGLQQQGLGGTPTVAADAAGLGAVPRPSVAGSSQGTKKHRTSKVVSCYEDLLQTGDSSSTSSEEDHGDEGGDYTPLSNIRMVADAAHSVSLATQQAVTATQQACHLLGLAQMLVQKHQLQEQKPAASDRSSQPSGGEIGSEQQQIDATVMQRLNNQMSNGDKQIEAAGSGTVRLEDSVRQLLEEHFDRMQKLQQQLQQELALQLAAVGMGKMPN